MKVTSRWTTAPLGDVVEETQYGTPLKANEEGAGVPVLRMNNITYSGVLDLTDLKHVEVPDRSFEQYSVRRGDLLFNRTNSQELVGKMAVWNRDEQYAFAGYLVRLRLKLTRADPAFVGAWFNTPEMKALLRTRAKPSINMANISATEVLKFPVVLPPLPEQRRIAALLDRAEALRAKRRAALAQLDALTQSLFLDLFGDPVTNPKRWPRKPLVEIGNVITGNTPPRANPGYYGTHIEWAKSDNINTPHYYLTKATEGLSESGKAVARTAPAGSILVTCIAGSPECIGNAAMTDREVAFNQQINAFVPISGDVHFLYAQMRVGKTLIQAASTAGMKGMVSKGRFERILLIFPPIELQCEFSRRVTAVEKLKTSQRASLAALDALFASLQYRAFRGEL